MPNANSKAKVVFLGTGTSEGVPRVTCLTAVPPACPVCIDAIRPSSKNRRRNTSLVIQREQSDRPPVNIVVDAGKFFYESAIKWFPHHSIRSVDAVLLTHSHADAAGGLDDLRDWTNAMRFASRDEHSALLKSRRNASIPIYLREIDLEVVAKTSYYLVDRSQITVGGTVAFLDFLTIDDGIAEIAGTKFKSLTVPHGPNYSANGYRIGNFAYISDASDLPPNVIESIRDVEILVLDALRRERTHGSHLTLEQAVEWAKLIRPQRTLLTDAAHTIDHYETNSYLRRHDVCDGLDIQYAYDGMSLEIEAE